MAHRPGRYGRTVPRDVVLDPGRPGAPGLPDRWRASLAARRARREARRAAREEQLALLRLGESLARAGQPLGDGMRAALEDLAALDSALAATRAAMAATWQDDRADYAAVSPWVRPVVIARGVTARAVHRARLRQLGRDREAACRRLGAAALEVSAPVPDGAAALAADAREARVRVAAASGQAEALLAPFGGSALPRSVHHVGREAAAFARPLAGELRGHLLPRVPALAGLVAGWWVASTFTDSRLSATLHSLGIGSGPRRAVSGETMRALSFWAPILAAALCSYLGNRLAALVRARYAAAPDATSAPPGAAPSPSSPPRRAAPAPPPSRGGASTPPCPRRGPSSPP